MWKHEIIEYLHGEAPMSPAREKSIPFFDTILPLVKSAQTFFFGDFEKIENVYKTNEGRKFTTRFDNPYESTLFEWSENEEEYCKPYYKKAPKKAVLLVGNKLNGTQYMVGFWYSRYIVLENGTQKENWSWFISPIMPVSTDEKSQLNWCTWFGDGDSYKRLEEIADKVRDEVNVDYGIARLYLDVLNCQNIITKDVIPPEKLNKKRIRNGKLPLYTYKILEVVKGKPKSRDGGAVPWDYKSPASVRFHLCRGHFKTFTPDKPLFGKYSGTFWWNPQSRGNKELGEIEKDYEVKVV